MTRLYYFVGDHWVLDNLQKQRMKISRFGDLNDPYELYGLRVPDLADWEEACRAVYHETKGLLCFSKSFSSPIMWSHYADKHKGACFGFDIETDVPLYEVKYVLVPELIQAPAELTTAMEAYQAQSAATSKEALAGQLQSFVDQMLTHKHEAWRYEQEVRALVQLEEQENGNHFKTICGEGLVLREVILGVRSMLDPTEIQSVLKAFRQEVSIFRAELSRERYEVKKEIIRNRQS